MQYPNENYILCSQEISPEVDHDFPTCVLFIPFIPLFVYGATQLYENSDLVYDYVTNCYDSVVARLTGIRHFTRDGTEVYRELNEEYGKRTISMNDRDIVVEGYHNDGVLSGPGKISIILDGKMIHSKGMFKNNYMDQEHVKLSIGLMKRELHGLKVFIQGCFKKINYMETVNLKTIIFL
jgi:hypothetical protein